MNNFTLMILCAGFGSRMLNLTRSTPKPLLKYKNKVLLKNTIDFFTNMGCDEILINTHYLHNKIKKYFDCILIFSKLYNFFCLALHRLTFFCLHFFLFGLT